MGLTKTTNYETLQAKIEQTGSISGPDLLHATEFYQATIEALASEILSCPRETKKKFRLKAIEYNIKNGQNGLVSDADTSDSVTNFGNGGDFRKLSIFKDDYSEDGAISQIEDQIETCSNESE